MRRIFVAIALLCLLAPAGALASKRGGERLIHDCTEDAEITHGPYTQSDYTYALSHLVGDAAEYTNCDQVIRAARRAAAGGHRGSGGGGGGGGGLAPSPAGPAPAPSAPTPAEKSAIAGARKAPAAVNVDGGSPLTPGGPGITTTSFTRAVPGSMLVVLILVMLGSIAAASRAIRSRVLARRQG